MVFLAGLWLRRELDGGTGLWRQSRGRAPGRGLGGGVPEQPRLDAGSGSPEAAGRLPAERACAAAALSRPHCSAQNLFHGDWEVEGKGRRDNM